jgi:hypothetical protein
MKAQSMRLWLTIRFVPAFLFCFILANFSQFLISGEKSVTQPSEAGDKFGSPDRPNSRQHITEPRLNSHGIPASDSYFESTVSSFWDRNAVLICIRYRILPFLWRFFE